LPQYPAGLWGSAIGLGNVRQYLRGAIFAWQAGGQARSKKPAQMAGGRAGRQARSKKPAQKAG